MSRCAPRRTATAGNNVNTRNIVWWGLFLGLGIWMQQMLPGIDVLVIGLILALQERDPLQLGWVFFILILLQEGVGSLDFGATLLWYATVIVFFYLGHWLFETENFLFVFLLSACIGAGHFAIMWMMCFLQYIPVDDAALLDESILQALFIPFAWKIASFSRRWVVDHEDPA